jgi:hypothetical protein
MTKKLDVAVNVAIIVTCLITSAVLLTKFHIFPSGRPAPRTALQRGDRLPPDWHIDLAPRGPAVIAVIRSSCGFCTESMPFYRQLSLRGRGVHFVAVSNEPATTTQAYLASHGVTATQVVSLPGGVPGVNGTPTLLAVDRAGVIRDRRTGLLAPNKQQEFLESLAQMN